MSVHANNKVGRMNEVYVLEIREVICGEGCSCKVKLDRGSVIQATLAA